MLGSSEITVLLMTRRVLARVDLRGGRRPSVRRVWLRERFDSESLATLIDATYRLGPKRSGRVWVAASEFWTGVVEVPRDVVRMVSDDELPQAVAGEAETYSGISAFDSRSGLRSLPENAETGDTAWWCTQVPNAEIADAKLTLESMKATWGGAVHPAVASWPALAGGSAGGASGGDAEAWMLTQSWDDQTLCARGVGDMLTSMISWVGSLDSGRTLLDWQEWTQSGTPGASTGAPGSTAARRVWMGDHEPPAAVAEEGWEVIRVDQEEGLRRWAVALATGLSSKAAGAVPAVEAEKEPLSNERATAIAVGLGILAMAGCFGHHKFVVGQIADAQAEVEQLQGREKLLKDTEQQLDALRKESQELKESIATKETDATQMVARLRQAEDKYRYLRQRWLTVMDALERCADEQCWVREIRRSGEGIELLGVATSTTEANHFSRDLQGAVRGRGWVVLPARSEPQDQGLVEFTIEMNAAEVRQVERTAGEASGTLQAGAESLTGAYRVGNVNDRDANSADDGGTR